MRENSTGYLFDESRDALIKLIAETTRADCRRLGQRARALWDEELRHIRQKELDALRLTAAEYQALQARWAQDTQTLEAIRIELASARSDLTKERERREQAEADALRAGVRRDTLEQLLAQLRPDHADGSSAKKKSGI